MNWYLNVIRNYVNFNGRARRKEYWMFVLLNVIIMIALEVPAIFVFQDFAHNENRTFAISFFAVLFLYALFLILPTLAVSVRRMHDIGKSGAWYFIQFIPLVGPIWFLVLLVTEGQQGPNRYGPDPKRSKSFDPAGAEQY